MGTERPAARTWGGEYSLIVWALGLITIISFSFLQLINEWLARILIELVIVLIPILFVYALFYGTIKNLGFVKPSARDVVIAIGGGLFAVLVGTLSFQLIVLIYGDLPPGYIEFQNKFTPQTIVDLIIWVAFSLIIVGPCEEIFSRGFIQKGFEKSTGVIAGLIMSSVMFGILHLDIWRMFPTAMQGLVFGGIYIYTGRKSSASAISHGVTNSVIFILMFLMPYYYGL
ncbi:MAG: lysostaphin resistance A-like protein [Candidatus Odinarchaeia archaeon]